MELGSSPCPPLRSSLRFAPNAPFPPSIKTFASSLPTTANYHGIIKLVLTKTAEDVHLWVPLMNLRSALSVRKCHACANSVNYRFVMRSSRRELWRYGRALSYGSSYLFQLNVCSERGSRCVTPITDALVTVVVTRHSDVTSFELTSADSTFCWRCVWCVCVRGVSQRFVTCWRQATQLFGLVFEGTNTFCNDAAVLSAIIVCSL